MGIFTGKLDIANQDKSWSLWGRSSGERLDWPGNTQIFSDVPRDLGSEGLRNGDGDWLLATWWVGYLAPGR